MWEALHLLAVLGRLLWGLISVLDWLYEAGRAVYYLVRFGTWTFDRAQESVEAVQRYQWQRAEAAQARKREQNDPRNLLLRGASGPQERGGDLLRATSPRNPSLHQAETLLRASGENSE